MENVKNNPSKDFCRIGLALFVVAAVTSGLQILLSSHKFSPPLVVG